MIMTKGKIVFDEEEFVFYDVIDKTPTEAKNGTGKVVQARLYLPKEWIGKKVRVFRLEE